MKTAILSYTFLKSNPNFVLEFFELLSGLPKIGWGSKLLVYFDDYRLKCTHFVKIEKSFKKFFDFEARQELLAKLPWLLKIWCWEVKYYFKKCVIQQISNLLSRLSLHRYRVGDGSTHLEFPLIILSMQESRIHICKGRTVFYRIAVHALVYEAPLKVILAWNLWKPVVENFGSLHWHALIDETVRFFRSNKKVHFGLTFGACTIASVSYTGACTNAGEYGMQKIWKFVRMYEVPPQDPYQ